MLHGPALAVLLSLGTPSALAQDPAAPWDRIVPGVPYVVPRRTTLREAVFEQQFPTPVQAAQGWLPLGLVGGLCGGPTGCLLVTAAAASVPPRASGVFWSQTDPYQAARYREWQREVKRVRTEQAFAGGTLGAGLTTACVLAVFASTW